MWKFPLVAAAAITLAGCSGTSAQTDVEETPPAVSALQAQGLTIHGELDVPGGLRAFGASAGNNPVAVYVLPDPNYAIVGTLVDSKGFTAAEAELRKVVTAPIEQSTWEALEKADWVGEGNADAERVVYTFTDANCPFCHQLWLASRPWVESGAVQLRHIMVGVIRPDSAAKAAAILEAPDPAAALEYNETNRDSGGIEPVADISDSSLATLNANLTLMSDLGFGGTPGVVGRRADGSLIISNGMPSTATMDELFGPL
jgi:Protein-disulfide isomerase